MTTLTKEEKLSVINQHLKTVDYALYHLELDLIEAEAATSPDAETIATINGKKSALDAKRDALASEKTSVEAEQANKWQKKRNQ